MIIDYPKIVQLLKEGGLIVYPTDTVWGLGCDATNPEAVQKVFAIKKREMAKSLVCLVKNEVVLEQYAPNCPDVTWDLLEHATTPLTLVLPASPKIASGAQAEDGTTAFRIPNHPFLNKLFQNCRLPLVSTSANISGEPSPKTLQQISPEILDAVDWVCPDLPEFKGSGKPSSIVKLSKNSDVEIIRK